MSSVRWPRVCGTAHATGSSHQLEWCLDAARCCNSNHASHARLALPRSLYFLISSRGLPLLFSFFAPIPHALVVTPYIHTQPRSQVCWECENSRRTRYVNDIRNLDALNTLLLFSSATVRAASVERCFRSSKHDPIRASPPHTHSCTQTQSPSPFAEAPVPLCVLRGQNILLRGAARTLPRANHDTKINLISRCDQACGRRRHKLATQRARAASNFICRLGRIGQCVQR